MAVNQRKAGAILSYVQMILSTVTGLLYTPIMLRILGQSEYGLFGTASSLTSFLSLLSFGLSGAYIKFVMEYRVIGDKKGENRLNGLFLIMYSVAATFVLIAGAVLIFSADSIYHNSLSVYEISQIKIIIFLTVLNTILTFVFLPVMMYIQSLERYLFLRILAIVTSILNPILNIVVLLIEPRAVSISIITVVLAFATYIVQFIYAYKKLGMRFSFRKIQFSVFKGVFAFSGFLFINEITQLITNNTDKIVLGVVSGTVAVAIYTVGNNFTNYLYTCSTSISTVFSPKINKIVASAKEEGTNPDAQLNKLFVKVGRLQFLILTLILVGFSSLGRQFIILWAGEDYSNSFWIALLLMFAPYVPLMQNIGLEVQKAKNLHKARSLFYFIVSILNAAVTIPVAAFFSQKSFSPGAGGIAAAAATFGAMMIGQVLFMNIYYQKKVGIDVISFWKEIIKMLPGIILPLAAGLLLNIFLPASNFYILLAEILVVTVIYFFSTYFLSMNRYEKDLVVSPIKKLGRKIRKRK
ncbi:MAG: oligosaccharide flippase family protein [Ruminococcus sp.]|nr:oligosaccharide flippase family protein [Ruminococcus sp.]